LRTPIIKDYKQDDESDHDRLFDEGSASLGDKTAQPEAHYPAVSAGLHRFSSPNRFGLNLTRWIPRAPSQDFSLSRFVNSSEIRAKAFSF
jgi:hypothetical protein